MPLQSRVGRGIHPNKHGLPRSKRRINLCQRRIGRLTRNIRLKLYLRIHLGDHIPADSRADKSLFGLQFLVESLGSFGKSIPAQEHGDTGERAAYISDRIAGVTKAKRILLPLWILLGE